MTESAAFPIIDAESRFERGSFSIEIQPAFRFLMNRQAENVDMGITKTEAFSPDELA